VSSPQARTSGVYSEDIENRARDNNYYARKLVHIGLPAAEYESSPLVSVHATFYLCERKTDQRYRQRPSRVLP
jgi:hypothetical protein